MAYYTDLLKEKTLTDDQEAKEWKKLEKYDATENKRSFAGNNLIYHFFLDKMCETATDKGDTIKALMTNQDALPGWLEQMKKMNRTGSEAVRLFECIRVCRVPVAFFKPTIAKHIYKSLGATAVLDPCAGWGGRLLGAISLGIPYTGFDTNHELASGYLKMLSYEATSCLENNTSPPFNTKYVYAPEGSVEKAKWKIIFQSCLEADFSKIDYDLVLTSPPYYNLEVYQGMPRFASEDAFYKDFLIPLLDKCRKHIKKHGKVLFNISPKMYKKLTGTYKYPSCVASYHMLQQKRKGVDKGDLIYCWNSI
jgi:hypothetical protein